MKSVKSLLKTDTLEIIRESARLLDEKKGVDIVLLDLMEVNSYLDYFIIATGNSIIHCRALAKEMISFFSSIGIKERGSPQFESEWILLDFNEIIIHIFTETMRDYYQLEKLWHDAKKIDF